TSNSDSRCLCDQYRALALGTDLSSLILFCDVAIERRCSAHARQKRTGMKGDWHGAAKPDLSRSSLRPRASWPDSGTDPQSDTFRIAGGAPRRHSDRAE